MKECLGDLDVWMVKIAKDRIVIRLPQCHVFKVLESRDEVQEERVVLRILPLVHNRQGSDVRHVWKHLVHPQFPVCNHVLLHRNREVADELAECS
jgi:hypothetical protein